MSTIPLRPAGGSMPADQITVPRPPLPDDARATGVMRKPQAVSLVDSYRQTVLRIWPDGPQGAPFDLVPDEDPLGADAITAPDQAYFVAGTHAFGRLTTRADDAASLRALQEHLDLMGRDWIPAVATSPDRQWVERGALVRNVPLADVEEVARQHGQDVIVRWDSDGLAPLPARVGVELPDISPVRVCAIPGRTGCPMRLGADDVCTMDGGAWTSTSRTAALLWQAHRRLLVDAFGCEVCHSEGGNGPIGLTELFTPSRAGGWQFGGPLTTDQLV